MFLIYLAVGIFLFFHNSIFKFKSLFPDLSDSFNETLWAGFCIIVGAVTFSQANWAEDAELVKMGKQGDRNAYGELFKKYC